MKALFNSLNNMIQAAFSSKGFMSPCKPNTICIALLAMALLSPPSQAEVLNPSITIHQLEHFQKDGQLLINSHISFRLPDKIIAAIDHEIPIDFKTEILLNEQQTFLNIAFDRNRQSIVYRTKLFAYGVNRLYLLHNSRNDKRQAFPTIETALQTLGTIQAFPVIELAELHPEQSYQLKMRISLDRWTLPSPLLIDSLVDENWQMTSDWFEIKIQTPKSWM